MNEVVEVLELSFSVLASFEESWFFIIIDSLQQVYSVLYFSLNRS